jgi:hypothetical protein
MKFSRMAHDPGLHTTSRRRSGVSGSVPDRSGALSLYGWFNGTNGNEHEYQLGPWRVSP